MSAARWTDRAPDGADEAEPSEQPVEADGPFDATDLDLEQTDAVGRLDFESLRVPMPDGARLQIEKLPDGRLKAVHVMVECGRLSVSALAAPKSGRLWPELADEVARSLQKDGARVRVEPGVWGREVVAWAGDAQSRFVGVDGQRWMLYGISTGAATHANEAAEILRDMIRGTIVVRGSKPYPVRTVLPLSLPPHLVPLLERLEAQADRAHDGDGPGEEPSEAPAQPRGTPSPPPAAARPVVPAARRVESPDHTRRPPTDLRPSQPPLAAPAPHVPAAPAPRVPAPRVPAASAPHVPARGAPVHPVTPIRRPSPPTAPPPPRPPAPAAPPEPAPQPAPAAPPTNALEDPLTAILPHPSAPPTVARPPDQPTRDGTAEPWLPPAEPITPITPITPIAPIASLDPLDPLDPPAWPMPVSAADGADPGPPQEPAWLSMQEPGFADDDAGSGRHRAPERESGRHRRP